MTCIEYRKMVITSEPYELTRAELMAHSVHYCICEECHSWCRDNEELFLAIKGPAPDWSDDWIAEQWQAILNDPECPEVLKRRFVP